MSSSEPGKKRRKTMSSAKPEKKRRKTNPTPESTSILSLPDDLLLSCIGRVSRLYYRTLSLVSKRFRSLLASPDLYKMRSLSGRTESCLYVCFDCFSGCRWYTLSRNPDRHVLTRVPTPNSHRARFPNLVAVGSDIYNIAEPQSILSSQSSIVSIMDCRSHTWRQGPSFPVELRSLTACVVDRKIYVAYSDSKTDSDPESDSDSEGDPNANRYTKAYAKSYSNYTSCSEKLVKVLDTDTQTWDHVPVPSCDYFSNESACIDGKFHLVIDEELVAYDSHDGRWSMVARASAFLNSDSYCSIGNVLYYGDNGYFKWYDTKARRWRELKGLVGLPKIPIPQSASCGVILADYGGKLAVLWEEKFPSFYRYLSVGPPKKMIWCAVIALERRTDCDIWGEVEWCNRVLDVPESSSSWKALATTV